LDADENGLLEVKLNHRPMKSAICWRTQPNRTCLIQLTCSDLDLFSFLLF